MTIWQTEIDRDEYCKFPLHRRYGNYKGGFVETPTQRHKVPNVPVQKNSGNGLAGHIRESEEKTGV